MVERRPGMYINGKPSEETLARMRARNNPKNEPIGHFTGRCGRCGSKNLWDDNSAYGCSDCGAIYCG